MNLNCFKAYHIRNRVSGESSEDLMRRIGDAIVQMRAAPTSALPGTATLDRFVFFDGNGRFIEGYYLVGLLTKALRPSFPATRSISAFPCGEEINFM